LTTIQLTDISVRALKPPEKGQVTYHDKSLPGFGLRLSQGGTRVYTLMYGADRRRVTIGKVGVISLRDARSEAKRILAEHTLGKGRPTEITFSDAVESFLEASRQRNRPKTVREYQRLLNKHFRFAKVLLENVTQAEVMRRINRLKNTPREQNYAFVVARVFFRWTVKNRYIDRSPIDGLSLPAVTHSRERVLSPAELGAVYSHALAFPYPFGPIVALCILTGQRRGEIAVLQWDWIDRKDQTITLPATATKNKRTHTFPYGVMASEIIEGLPELAHHLFPATRSHVRGKPTTVFNGWSKAKQAFDMELEGVQPFTLHDLRRTFSSTLASLRVPIYVTEKLLNHSSGPISGVAAIYNRHSYLDEMREALVTYENHLASLLHT
jgi:integrase